MVLMIQVTIEILAGIQTPRKDRIAKLELSEEATVKDALLMYGFEEKQIEFLRVWRGEELADLHTKLEDEDRLAIAIPLSGGSSHQFKHFLY